MAIAMCAPAVRMAAVIARAVRVGAKIESEFIACPVLGLIVSEREDGDDCKTEIDAVVKYYFRLRTFRELVSRVGCAGSLVVCDWPRENDKKEFDEIGMCLCVEARANLEKSEAK